MENNMISFLKRASDRTGFIRETYIENNIPTISSNVTVMPFFGDVRSTFILSSLLLRRYKEHERTYFIFCSWPGLQELFPFVDEYWSVKDNSSVQSLALSANNFYNTSDLNTSYTRSLIQHFENVVTYDDLKCYYDNGITPKFWEDFKNIKRFLPAVPSSNRLSDVLKAEMNRRSGHKIVVYPSFKVRSWRRGNLEYVDAPRDFWVTLIERLLSEGYVPVVYQNAFTYDMSMDFADKCIWLVSKNVSDIMSAMRTAGCVLDIHSGVSRLAVAARCPFVCLDERARYVHHKEYEIDDLCAEGLPRQYALTLSSLITEAGINEWQSNVIDTIMIRLGKFLPSLDRNNLPSGTESYDEVSYDRVRDRKERRMGVRFIKKY